MNALLSESGISYIVLSYNRKDDLAHTLEVLSQGCTLPHEIIVVDNASTDGSPEMVASRFPFVRLLVLPNNVGIAGWNAGFAVARMPYYFVLDDDSWPVLGSAERCIAMFAEDSSCGIVACSILDRDGNHAGPLDVDESYARNFIGCGAVISRTLYNRIGGYDKRIFLYVHELEYSIRTLQAGFTIKYCADAKVIHAQSQTNRYCEESASISGRYLYHANKGEFYIFLRFFPLRDVTFRLIRMLVGRIVFAFGHGCLLLVTRAIWSGVIMGWLSREKRFVLTSSLSSIYGRGSFAGGLFGPPGLAYRNPMTRAIRHSKGAECTF